ncbi:MAG: RyR domain-containing protein [Acetobacteraceae bacterium]
MVDGRTPPRVVVTGDALWDHHIYEGEWTRAGERAKASSQRRRGVRVHAERGGAAALHRLLWELIRQGSENRSPARDPLAETQALTLAIDDRVAVDGSADRGYAVWAPFPATGTTSAPASDVWRVKSLMGYGDGPDGGWQAAGIAEASARQPADLLVIDDAGVSFRHTSAADIKSWACSLADDGFILLKMAEPIAQSAVWQALEQKHRQLVVVVSARDLRRETVALSRGLSWEATLDEMRVALHTHPLAQSLLRCRYLIVTFSMDGALLLDLDEPDRIQARLCLDPARAEGEWSRSFAGETFGFQAVMTASLAWQLREHIAERRSTKPESAPTLDLLPALEAGLLGMRDLRRNGHGPVAGPSPAGFPAQRLACRILEALPSSPATAAGRSRGSAGDRMSRLTIAWRPSDRLDPSWSMIADTQGRASPAARPQPLIGLARQIARFGIGVLDRLPRAQFGKLLAADRNEIEALRTIRRCMIEYRDNEKPKRPLSIGVFGPPGAGKSFGVEQLANEIFSKEAWRAFNLSQFQNSDELNGAYHQVRDLALAGITPVVFWDEFDSRDLYWLQYLLAPMQDGRFQHGQLQHSIGKCVFIFAGGTSWAFEEFTPQEPAALAAFRRLKGPDFVSRLDAYMNVLGPNPRMSVGLLGRRMVDPADISYPIRRALLIRAHLGCDPRETVDFDPALLHALLRVGTYRHGSRSLEKLVLSLRGDDPTTVRRSNLPHSAQLGMHVDAEEFTRAMNQPPNDLESGRDDEAIETIAAAVHQTWRALSDSQGGWMHARLNKPYADLPEPDKEDNRAAARRMTNILTLAGLTIAREGQALEDHDVRDRLERNIERLAEAEHDEWMAHRQRNGWRFDPTRCDAKKHHPLLIPYADLPEKEKDKDRANVRHYPDFAKSAGYRIVLLT